jgi:hypothetical protein
LLAVQTRHERQRLSLVHATPAAGVGSREAAGRTASAPPLLNTGDADAELAGKLTSQSRPFVAGLGALGTSIRCGDFHATTLLLHRSTAT